MWRMRIAHWSNQFHLSAPENLGQWGTIMMTLLEKWVKCTVTWKQNVSQSFYFSDLMWWCSKHTWRERKKRVRTNTNENTAQTLLPCTPEQAFWPPASDSRSIIGIKYEPDTEQGRECWRQTQPLPKLRSQTKEKDKHWRIPEIHVK